MKTMNISVEDACDTGLVLGLGRGDPPPKSMPSPSNPMLGEPSLTLGLSDKAYISTPIKGGRPSSSPHSANSSFWSANPSNIKQENDIVNEEAERVSSRTSDEEEEGGARKKLRLTKKQSALLEDKFKEHTTLDPKQKQGLARQLNLRPRQVEVWFQNRRARTKLKQTEVACEVLKRCCETLRNENRRLQKDLEELNALKVAPLPPMYMPTPATLTLCPSCERVSGAAGGGAKAVAGPFILLAPKAHQFFNPFTRSAAC